MYMYFANRNDQRDRSEKKMTSPSKKKEIKRNPDATVRMDKVVLVSPRFEHVRSKKKRWKQMRRKILYFKKCWEQESRESQKKRVRCLDIIGIENGDNKYFGFYCIGEQQGT